MRNVLIFIIAGATSLLATNQVSMSVETGISTSLSHAGLETRFRQGAFFYGARIFSEYYFSEAEYGDWVETNLHFVRNYETHSRYQVSVGRANTLTPTIAIPITFGLEFVDAYNSYLAIDTNHTVLEDYRSGRKDLFGFSAVGLGFHNRAFITGKVNHTGVFDYSLEYRTKSFPWHFCALFERNYIGLEQRTFTHAISCKLTYDLFKGHEKRIPLLPSEKDLPFTKRVGVILKNFDKLLCMDIFVIGIIGGMAAFM